MANDIENELVQTGSAEISYATVGDLVMKKLFKADSVAYVRFASVYKEFREVGEFVKLVMEEKG